MHVLMLKCHEGGGVHSVWQRIDINEQLVSVSWMWLKNKLYVKREK